jgi:asparagine synthase (glutamine-hydrolysing)
MPVQNGNGDITLFFSGEEYARGRGTTPLCSGDCELDHDLSYLVEEFETSPCFPAQLNGRFHGIAIDRRKGSVQLFNDRYGMQRIYYREEVGTFYFAAEAKAILAVRPECRSLDYRGLGEFVSCGCVLENRTLFAGISVLPPASVWELQRNGGARRRTYFSPAEWEEQESLDTESYYRNLRDVFARNLHHYFSGSERIGMSVTGGLDTRMVLALRKPEPDSLPCYSFGGMFRESKDVIIGRKIAQACGQTHEVIRVADQFLSQFPRYAERTVYLTDGCTDVSHSPDLYVNERAAQIAPVRMTGNYGGEVLRRVRAFKPVKSVAGMFSPDFAPFLEHCEITYQQLIRTHPLTFAVFRQAPWHHFGLFSLEQTQLSMRSPFLDNDLIQTIYRAPASSCNSSGISLRLIAEAGSALARIRTDRGERAMNAGKRTGPDVYTRFLRELSNWTAKAEYACDYGMPQWLVPIDGMLGPLAPSAVFLGRNKFYHFRIWYRRCLRRYVQDMLLDERTLSRQIVQRDALLRVVKQHLSGEANHTLAIHKLLTVELVHRQLIEQP